MLNRLAGHSPLGRVFAAGLRNVKSSREVMKEAIEEAGRGVTHELERFLTSLGTIASISPLMGLFGTVVGMIEIFGSQTPVRHQSAAAGARHLGGAVQHRLRPHHRHSGMIFYRHFRALVDSFVVEMEQQAVKLVEMVHGERR